MLTKIANEDVLSYLEKFRSNFPDDLSCISLLATKKWKDGFVCTKCGNTNYCKGKTDYSRRCTRCKKEESATANTVFHRCKFSIKKAFEIVILTCQTSVISSYKTSDILELRHMTCYSFQKKVAMCLGGGKGCGLLKDLIISIKKKIEDTDNSH
jgi:hypothetical protein